MMARIKSLIKKYGIVGFIKKALRRICSFVFSYRPVYIYGISSLPSHNLEPRCPLEIRKGTEQDTDLVLELMNHIKHNAYLNPIRKRALLHRLKARFDGGNEPFLAFGEGTLAHVSWLFHPPKVKETLLEAHIGNDQRLIGVCLTVPEFRGKNIYPVVLQHILRNVFAQGIKTVFITTSPSNIASIRGIEKVGFRRLKKVRGFILFGKKFNHYWQAIDTCDDNQL